VTCAKAHGERYARSMLCPFLDGTTESVRMTQLSDFSDDELAQILDAPGAVLKGATLADGKPGPIRFIRELASGAKVFREAQVHENDFVQSVAVALREREASGDDEAPVSGDGGPASDERVLPDPEGEAARAVELTAASIALLRGRADEADVDAYGEWLVRIATQVAKATRSKEGGFLSKRVAVSADEQAFIEKLTAAVGR
jgi:hypothetical protein